MVTFGILSKAFSRKLMSYLVRMLKKGVLQRNVGFK